VRRRQALPVLKRHAGLKDPRRLASGAAITRALSVTLPRTVRRSAVNAGSCSVAVV